MGDGTLPHRYRAFTRQNLPRTPYWSRLPLEVRDAVNLVARVLPFRVSSYVLEELIDWDRIPEDPIFQLTFPQEGFLAEPDRRTLRELLDRNARRDEIDRAVREIRLGLNPQPADQVSKNVPVLDGRPLAGIQHKYAETVLFFPAAGQTCHAYCTYCFRWAQFVALDDLRFQARDARDLVTYLRLHPKVTDVLLTGGDPLIMSTHVLRSYLRDLLDADLPHVRTIRIGTKAFAYWPRRFLTDPDADELLRMFEEVVARGWHLAIMAHFSHPAELEPAVARRAIRRVQETGAVIRMQAPLVRLVNDDPQAWAELWGTGARLGMVPYYLFVERDTGPRKYFEVPLVRAHEIFQDAYRRVSGLARTVRGPVMSASPGKVRILGTAKVVEEEVLVLDYLQARDSDRVRRPFFAKAPRGAAWFDELEPLSEADRPFFESSSVEQSWQAGRNRASASPHPGVLEW